jgi:hypothetical protein
MTTLTLRDLGFVGGLGGYDADALTYIAAVETADGQSLEVATKDAINAFVVGCKSDGIWSAIKASCIMAGARTLAGALVPLVGDAPTNFNFVSGDYNRKTGLVGNGSTKYLNSNRANNADPQNNHHLSIYVSTNPGVVAIPIGLNPVTNGNANGETDLIFVSGSGSPFRSRAATPLSGTSSLSTLSAVGLLGMSRSTSSQFTGRASGTNDTITQTSADPSSVTATVFARNTEYNTRNAFTSARLAFYSIGESLDLALLDSRITALITAIGAAF